MNEVRPRRLIHRGVVDAAGFLLDPRLIGTREARRRVLAAWTSGALVYRVGDLLMLRLPAPVRVACDAAMGTPLAAAGRVYLAAPLAADELKTLAPPDDALVVAQGGQARVITLTGEMLEPPESWLDVEEFKHVETTSLGAPASRPVVVAEPRPFDPRQQLEGVPPSAPAFAEFMNAMRERAAQAQAGAARREAQPGGAVGDWLAQALGRGAALLERAGKAVGIAGGWLVALLRRLRGAASSPAAPTRRATPPPSWSPPRPSLAERLSALMRRLTTRALIKTGLAAVVGRQQARYLAHMMELFERGDLQEALRYAIPLGGKAEAEILAPALRPPTPRLSLHISPGGVAARSGIGLGDELLNQIRQLYRASFERLAAQGKIEEAAFVLAELLHADEEAVAFLERHGRLRLAAEIAEARGLPPGLVVRQWFVAGDRARAVLIARRLKAFADAVARLERTDRAQAEVLRLLWAGTLAEAGDYAAAVDVIWPVASGRRLAAEWIKRAIAAGGVAGARMLARQLALAPDSFEAVRAAALALLDDERAEDAPARQAFALTLLGGPKTSEAGALARAAVRAVLRDAGATGNTITTAQYRNLVEFAGDGALRADAPPLVQAEHESLLARVEPLRVEIGASDVGTLPVHDAALLPDGRVIVALGEAGARLLTREGRTATHFDQPAHRLVISDHGDRAIALAPRGEVWRLARLDFLTRRAESWCEAKLSAFAPDYDGSAWFVGADEDFYMIDATARRFDALWRVPDVGGEVIAAARSASYCRFLTGGEWNVIEEWAYELPSMRLRGRTGLRSSDPHPIFYFDAFFALSADGKVIKQSRVVDLKSGEVPPGMLHGVGQAKTRLQIFTNGAPTVEATLGSGGEVMPGLPAINSRWAAAPVFESAGVEVMLLGAQQGLVRLKVSLARTTRVALRPSDTALTVADDQGRVLVLDLEQGRRLRDFRL